MDERRYAEKGQQARRRISNRLEGKENWISQKLEQQLSAISIEISLQFLQARKKSI